MRVLVTGSRNWDDADTMRYIMVAFLEGERITLIHGDCEGADKLSARIATELDLLDIIELEDVLTFPAEWHKYGRAAGPVRNKVMVESGVDLVLAFHEDYETSKGTKNCVELARKAGLQIILCEPVCDLEESHGD